MHAKIALALTLLLGAGACARTEPPVTTDTWKRFSSSDGRFSILFPVDPVEKVDTYSDQGRAVLIHRFMANVDRYEYEVDYADFNREPREAFNWLEQEFWSRVGKESRVVFKGDFELDGNPGYEIEVETPAGNRIRWKFLAVDGRLYQFGTRRPATTPDRGDVTLFMGSFELTPATATSPQRR